MVLLFNYQQLLRMSICRWAYIITHFRYLKIRLSSCGLKPMAEFLLMSGSVVLAGFGRRFAQWPALLIILWKQCLYNPVFCIESLITSFFFVMTAPESVGRVSKWHNKIVEWHQPFTLVEWIVLNIIQMPCNGGIVSFCFYRNTPWHTSCWIIL